MCSIILYFSLNNFRKFFNILCVFLYFDQKKKADIHILG